jgi:hypothetical protein
MDMDFMIELIIYRKTMSDYFAALTSQSRIAAPFCQSVISKASARP